MIYLKEINQAMIGQVVEKTQSIQVFMDKVRKCGTPVGFAKNTNSLKSPFLYLAKDGSQGFLELDFNIDTTGSYEKDQIANVLVEGVICLEADSTIASAEFGSVVYWDSGANKVTATQASNAKIGTLASSNFKAQSVGDSALKDAVFVKLESVGA